MGKSDMSAINGEGYGDKHDWERCDSTQDWNPIRRSTLYKCKVCGIMWRHYYHQVENIFEAMRLLNIDEECKRDEDQDRISDGP
jgi:hypothetical protein